MLPNATDLGSFSSRAAEQNARWNAAKAKRDREFTLMVSAPIIIALMGLYAWGALVVAPAWERTNNEYQEQVSWER